MKELKKKYNAEITNQILGTNPKTGSLMKKFDVDEYFDHAELKDGQWIDTLSPNNCNMICEENWNIESTVVFENGEPVSATYCCSLGNTSGDEIEDCVNGVMNLWGKENKILDITLPTFDMEKDILRIANSGILLAEDGRRDQDELDSYFISAEKYEGYTICVEELEEGEREYMHHFFQLNELPYMGNKSARSSRALSVQKPVKAEIDLISPTHGEKYKIKDILLKGLKRAFIDWVSFELKPMHTCVYGSTDYELHVESLECSESQHKESVTFRIIGVIPVHATKDGKLSVGYGCGCNSYHDQDPEPCQKWAAYKEKEMGSLFAWIPGDDIDIVTTSMEEVIEQEDCRKILMTIIKDMFSRSFADKWMHYEMQGKAT